LDFPSLNFAIQKNKTVTKQMKTKLIAITQPLVEGITSAEGLIAYCARVSNPSNQLNTETAPRLLAYCIRHGHWSVFETVSMTMEIVTSRAIAAQLLRHRSFTFQEFSQRYAESAAFERVELRMQDKKNRQGSGEECHNLDCYSLVNESVEQAFWAYSHMIDHGVSRETARMVLPLCTQTTIYMTGNVRSWIHYFEQRCAEHTQKEHRDVANSIKTIFETYFPTITKALDETNKKTGQ
jgi:thymidylate synthase (FAD)